jgi:hypothetical protein
VHVAAAGFQDEKQYRRWSVTAQSTWKKAGGQHRRGLRVQELPPGGVGLPFGCREDLERLEDPADRGGADPVTELE